MCSTIYFTLFRIVLRLPGLSVWISTPTAKSQRNYGCKFPMALCGSAISMHTLFW